MDMLGRDVESVGLTGATANYYQIGSIDIEDGRFFSETEFHNGANVIVLGAGVVDALFQDRNPTGKYVRLRGRRMYIIGTLQKQGSFLGLEDMESCSA